MEITPVIQIFAFAIFALIAVLGALGMATTMSMFRSGIFLMASFIGVAGLFILLLADLLALLQVMMYIGGMLVMILFMVLFSNDPGGAMMTSMMELPLVEKFFSLGLTHGGEMGMKGDGKMKSEGKADSEMKMPEKDGDKKQDSHANHGNNNEEIQAKQSARENHGSHEQKHGGEHKNHAPKDDGENKQKNEHEQPEKNQHGKNHGGMSGMSGMSGMNMEMDMEGMSMTTPIKKQAAILATLVGLLLGGLVLLRPAWKITNALPSQNSAEQVGNLLMEKYMIAFEGAGLLILLGIFGSVMVSRPARHPDSSERDSIKAAVDEKPAPVEIDPLEPIYKLDLPTQEEEYEQKQEAKEKKKEKDKEDNEMENEKKQTEAGK